MHRRESFVRLGHKLRGEMSQPSRRFSEAVDGSVRRNGWFTRDSIVFSLGAVCDNFLDERKIEAWLAGYPSPTAEKSVAVVTAGNIPLVGFHDIMCTLVSGHECLVKPSSKDSVITDYVVSMLREIDPGIPVRTLLETDVPDAVIATGSDNTNRYFRERYAGIPSLLRGNRTSAAVLSGGESDEELRLLGRDIFSYFGMGCRNVGRIFVPEGFDPGRLISALNSSRISHPGYISAYRRLKAILQMRGCEFVDCEFFTLRYSGGISEALPDIILTEYGSPEEVSQWLRAGDGGIQCVVSRALEHPRRVDFGLSQSPGLGDYPDGKDTMRFLSDI